MRVKGLLLALAMTMLTACDRELPSICKQMPPEDSRKWEQWQAGRNAANCEEELKKLKARAN